MKNILEKLIGKDIDLVCEGVALSGKVKKIDANILQLVKDELIYYVNIEKISVVGEAKDKKGNTPGFMNKK